MPIYYAIIKTDDQHDYIQRCIFSNQLEIYETKKDAQINCPKNCTVSEVEIKKHQQKD